MTRDIHQVRLRRGRRLWDLLSHTPYRIAEPSSEPLRELALEHLHLRDGDAVLDIGCGPGMFFQALREAVGAAGRIAGVDYSPRMLRRAQRRIEEHDWANVTVTRADASRTTLGRDEFDAAIAVASVSAMPDMRAAVENAYAALRPGGRLFVFDMRLVPSGRPGSRTTIRFFRLVYRALAGFTGDDVLAELRRTFDVVDLMPESGDAFAIALATKAAVTADT
jgi:ubiquinone/menaquinone biosynthesis C-methylase UbiE